MNAPFYMDNQSYPLYYNKNCEIYFSLYLFEELYIIYPNRINEKLKTIPLLK
jgi:hypothetical protein